MNTKGVSNQADSTPLFSFKVSEFTCKKHHNVKSEQATAHYAHLTIEPVRAAMQRAANAMDKQKNIETEKR